MEQLRITPEDFPYHSGTDGTSASDNKEAGTGNKSAQFRFMGGNIGGEERSGTADEGKN
jgi:hypothetical protein